MVEGFARHMRAALLHASFFGVTEMPIETAHANTGAVVGNSISVYDIQCAVFGGATLATYYKGRLAILELKEPDRPKMNQEVEGKEKLESRWVKLEAMVGSENGIRHVAVDLVEDFERPGRRKGARRWWW